MNKTIQPMVILNKYKNQVWPLVVSYLSNPKFPKQFLVPQKYLNYSNKHWEIVKDYPFRMGKYLRPTVLLLVSQAMGGEIKKSLLTAAAMQTSEEWILIHDDIEDDSQQRRGQNTLHKKYTPSLAINAGDALFAIQWKILIDNFGILPPKIVNKIMNEFFLIMSRTTLGQGVELLFIENKITKISDEDWMFIADGKTSYYSVAGPIRLGAIIAGASDKQLDTLTEFGLNLGRAYQIVDDILDLTSDFAGLKKQTGNDIYESKRTLILGHLIRNAKKDDKKTLIKIILKKRSEKTQKEVDWVISKMLEYKSIDYAKQMAEGYKKRADQILYRKLKFLNKEPYLSELKTLMNFILERDH